VEAQILALRGRERRGAVYLAGELGVVASTVGGSWAGIRCVPRLLIHLLTVGRDTPSCSAIRACAQPAWWRWTISLRANTVVRASRRLAVNNVLGHYS
jgi:hypothetical protein